MLTVRYLLASEMGEKGQRSLIYHIFPMNCKILLPDTDCYSQVHAGASQSREFRPPFAGLSL